MSLGETPVVYANRVSHFLRSVVQLAAMLQQKKLPALVAPDSGSNVNADDAIREVVGGTP